MSPRILAHGAMLLFTGLIATSYSVGGLIAGALAPSALTALRFLLAGLIFAAVLAARRQLAWPKPSSLLRFGAIGFLLAAYFVSMFEALRWTDPVSAGAVFTLVPVMSAAIATPLLGQRFGPRVWLGLAVGAAGALWVLFDGNLARLAAFHLGHGELIFLPGCLAYAAYAPVVRKLHRGESLAEINFFAILMGGLFTGLYGFRDIAATPWASLPWPVYLGIAHLAVFTTAATFLLIKFASLHLPAAKVMAYTYLLPAAVALDEGLIGHGWPSWPVVAGIAIAAMAVAIIAFAHESPSFPVKVKQIGV